MLRTISLSIYVMMLCTCTTTQAQKGFIGSATVGLNLSQIDGDDLSGFSKIGWSGGVRIGYPLLEKSDLSLELIYNQKGSNAGFGFGDDNSAYVTLNYFDIPITLDLKDWHVEDDNYFKASIHGGVSPSYLVSVGGNNDGFSNDIDDYRRLELAYLLGGTFNFSRNIGITVRYTRGLTTISEDNSTVPGNARAISYFWTFRTNYTF